MKFLLLCTKIAAQTEKLKSKEVTRISGFGKARYQQFETAHTIAADHSDIHEIDWF